MGAGQVLWAGTLGALSFADRLDAAVAGGYSGMSVFPWDCRPPAGVGTRAPLIRRQADAEGVRIVALDPVTTWLPARALTVNEHGASADVRARAGFVEMFNAYTVIEAVQMASGVGADLITVIEPVGRVVSTDRAAEAFASICDVAAAHDLRVQLEFMPFSGIPDLQSAWDIVRQAGRENGGLVLDSWHYFRSRPDHELLASLPPQTVFTVQLSDGPAIAEPDLWAAAAQARRLPGSGDFDLATMLAIVLATQPAAWIGPEVVSSALAMLDPRQAAIQAAEATAAAVSSAALT